MIKIGGNERIKKELWMNPWRPVVNGAGIRSTLDRAIFEGISVLLGGTLTKVLALIFPSLPPEVTV